MSTACTSGSNARSNSSKVQSRNAADRLPVAGFMKVKSITYATLRVTKAYENDRVEVTIELEKGDKAGDVVRKAKKFCMAALKCDGTTPATFEELYGDK